MPSLTRRTLLSSIPAGVSLTAAMHPAFARPEASPSAPEPPAPASSPAGSANGSAEGSAAIIPLWPGDAPPGGGGPGILLPLVSPSGAISRIAHPHLEVFRPAVPNGAAVLVAGGGGYQRISMRHEALPAAHWLQELGVTVFVLTYRLPQEGWHAGALAPMQDAQRALRLIHAQASTYGLDPARLGVLGFSAGGHLLGLCAARPEWRCYTPVDAADTVQPHVAVALLAYPVVTMEAPYQGTRSCHNLLGPHPSSEEARAWSIQTYIHKGCPPLFLVQAADDPITVPDNTALLQAACQRNTVPVTRYVFPTGGHGFGLGYRKTETSTWPHLAEIWMKQQHFIS
ncbi:alpha/beta hydrolase [Acetobacter farinalis]|uniref:Alpha/beta hydrolase n=1 Tax=Acetobacter farinalis TaxID=1260984 RepID=A0ABT3Q6W7_9PROT|nr:alpha/beta hydrolase [Acetobacter farinalis]MCX2561028.1 alpha/beta hydrolase [Acetobacter farinalis]NHO29722.1 alpha/beta hydrolase fold domain-containing protein [Acetobacter farinalis]